MTRTICMFIKGRLVTEYIQYDSIQMQGFIVSDTRNYQGQATGATYMNASNNLIL
jgi:hypothetical protein